MDQRPIDWRLMVSEEDDALAAELEAQDDYELWAAGDLAEAEAKQNAAAMVAARGVVCGPGMLECATQDYQMSQCANLASHGPHVPLAPSSVASPVSFRVRPDEPLDPSVSMGWQHFHNPGPALQSLQHLPTPARSAPAPFILPHFGTDGFVPALLSNVSPDMGAVAEGRPPLQAKIGLSGELTQKEVKGQEQLIRVPGTNGWWKLLADGLLQRVAVPLAASKINIDTGFVHVPLNSIVPPASHVGEKCFPPTYTEADKQAALTGQVRASEGVAAHVLSQANGGKTLGGHAMPQVVGAAVQSHHTWRPSVLAGLGPGTKRARGVLDADVISVTENIEHPCKKQISSGSSSPSISTGTKSDMQVDHPIAECVIPESALVLWTGVPAKSKGSLSASIDPEVALSTLLSVNPPAWAMSALTDKNGCEKVIAMLNDSTKRFLLMEMPDIIEALCRGLAAIPEAWSEPSVIMFRMIRASQKVKRTHIYQQLQEYVPIIPLVVILCCAGLNVGLICIQDALHKYRQLVNSNLKVHILEVICYEIDPRAIRVGSLVLGELPDPIRIVQAGDVKFAPEDCVFMADYPLHVKIVCLLSTECNAVSHASSQQFAPGKTGLHTPPSDTFHPAYHMVKQLQDDRGVENIVVIAELPLCKHKEDNAELSLKLGLPVIVRAKDYGDADRTRYIRTNPLIQERDIKKLNAAHSVDRPLMDGSTWCPSEGARKTAHGFPVTLRRFFPILCDQFFHGRKTLQNAADYEKLTLYNLRVKTSMGQLKYAGPHFFIDHLGLSSTALVRILDMYPCLKRCDRWGNLLQTQTTESQECGVNIFCKACREVMNLTGGCWHRPSMADVSFSVLALALSHWTNVQVGTWMTYKEPPHECGSECPKNARNW